MKIWAAQAVQEEQADNKARLRRQGFRRVSPDRARLNHFSHV